MKKEKNNHIATATNELSVSTEPLANALKGQSKINASFGDKFAISDFYHLSEIQQNERINTTVRRIIWAGFITIVVGIVFVYFGKLDVAIIATVSGLLTEVVSGIVMAFLTKSNKSKLQYFEQVSFNEECDKYIKEIRLLSDEEEKSRKLEKLIQNYCDRRK